MNIIERVLKFRDDRNWRQFHNPKDLAISISLEAAELLENFQWSGIDTEVAEKANEIQEELADVLIYCILLADSMNIDIDDIIRSKLEKNEEKYKIEKCYGNKKKYTELE
uniref:nucleotide pyrophosphohydrolase n=1 Tax=Vallitalea maricola TaxID=3074433 RepID=UPI0030D7CEF4